MFIFLEYPETISSSASTTFVVGLQNILSGYDQPGVIFAGTDHVCCQAAPV